MSSTFLDFYRELMSQIPGLEDSFLAKRIINRAYSAIKESRGWSWLRQEGIILAPAQITSGTVSVIQYSDEITFDATAIIALSTLAANTPSLTSRQIRVGGGPPYSLRYFDPLTGAAILDRPYEESDSPTATYKLLRLYYSPPSYSKFVYTDDSTPPTRTQTFDFLRWLSIWDAIEARPLDFYHSVSEINLRDPQRTGSRTPIWLAAFDIDSDTQSASYGLPRWEMWPSPTQLRAYRCIYQRRGVDFFLDTDTLPATIPESLLMEKAFALGCDWASKNLHKVPPDSRRVNFIVMAAKHQKAYMDELTRQQFNDKQLCTQEFELPFNPTLRAMGQGVLGSNFAQTHAVSLVEY